MNFYPVLRSLPNALVPVAMLEPQGKCPKCHHDVREAPPTKKHQTTLDEWYVSHNGQQVGAVVGTHAQVLRHRRTHLVQTPVSGRGELAIGLPRARSEDCNLLTVAASHSSSKMPSPDSTSQTGT